MLDCVQCCPHLANSFLSAAGHSQHTHNPKGLSQMVPTWICQALLALEVSNASGKLPGLVSSCKCLPSTAAWLVSCARRNGPRLMAWLDMVWDSAIELACH